MVKIVITEEEKELIEEINSGTFRTHEGWKRKGRVVMKGEEATLTTKVEGISIYLFSKCQTKKIKNIEKSERVPNNRFNDRDEWSDHDFDYDSGIDSLYGC